MIREILFLIIGGIVLEKLSFFKVSTNNFCLNSGKSGQKLFNLYFNPNLGNGMIAEYVDFNHPWIFNLPILHSIDVYFTNK